MKFTCRCGTLIHDATDELPHKAHVLPDRGMDALWGEIDALIENRCSSADERDRACTLLRILVGDHSRSAYQCSHCGAVYLHAHDGSLHCYLPADASSSRQIFAAPRQEPRA